MQHMVFCTEILDGWWSWEPLRRSCMRCGWCRACAARHLFFRHLRKERRLKSKETKFPFSILILPEISQYRLYQPHYSDRGLDVVCCHVEVSATGRSLVQRSPTEYVCVCVCVCVCVSLTVTWHAFRSTKTTTISIVLNCVNLNRLPHSLAGTVGLNPAGVMNVLSQVNVLYCQVEASATGRSLVQRSPAEWLCFNECDQVQR